MLLRLLTAQEDKPHGEQVDGNSDPRMSLDGLPGFLHAFAPMDVIQYEDRVVVRFGQALFEIVQGGFLGMVTIEEGQIQSLDALEHFRKSRTETAQHRNDVPLPDLFEVMLRDAEGLRA